MEEVFSLSSARISLHSARVLSLLVRMVKGFLVEYHLDGVSNYGSWKPWVLLNLEENEVKDFALIAMPSDSEFLLLSTLLGMVHTIQDTWLIDSGASRHMTGMEII